MKCERCNRSGRIACFAGTMKCPECTGGHPRDDTSDAIRYLLGRFDQGEISAATVRRAVGLPNYPEAVAGPADSADAIEYTFFTKVQPSHLPESERAPGETCKCPACQPTIADEAHVWKSNFDSLSPLDYEEKP